MLWLGATIKSQHFFSYTKEKQSPDYFWILFQVLIGFYILCSVDPKSLYVVKLETVIKDLAHRHYTATE
jgi:hypothetical protein